MLAGYGRSLSESWNMANVEQKTPTKRHFADKIGKGSAKKAKVISNEQGKPLNTVSKVQSNVNKKKNNNKQLENGSPKKVKPFGGTSGDSLI
ncbi:hypothetical protein NQ317_006175 [Molorchus minor]|uniref:Uncharacterized protein n=1 Tax=Molorchus minor TaxID=1323400 RepID=A0ABQ9JFI3_9CUCU|nr:hypothetical protein NQ317_006175 [Molorchus minor]